MKDDSRTQMQRVMMLQCWKEQHTAFLLCPGLTQSLWDTSLF